MEIRGQAGVEYLIIVGFVTFSIMAVVGLAYIYTGISKDQIRLNQVENFATKLINSAEAVFFAGEPSQSEISLYLPDGVLNITLSGNNLVITTSTSTGENIRAFSSNVVLSGIVSPSPGIKVLTILAKTSSVEISKPS